LNIYLLKGITPVIEVEKKNSIAELVPFSEDTLENDYAEKRPETDFHFFSDSEVTKYVICMS